MKCTNCKHEQDTGKFCGKCGNPMQTPDLPVNRTVETPQTAVSYSSASTQAADASAYQQPTAANEHVEKVKATSKQYGSYFLQFIKQPSSVLDNPTTNLVNALITITIFLLVTSLTLYKNIGFVMEPINNVSGAFGGSESFMPSFFSVFFATAFSLGAVFLLSITCLFLVNKFFGPNQPFAHIITSFGTMLVPSLVAIIVAYVLLLANSIGFGNLLLMATIAYSVFSMPLFLISRLLTEKQKSLDAYYGYLAYTILFGMSLIMAASMFYESRIAPYVDMLDNLFF